MKKEKNINQMEGRTMITKTTKEFSCTECGWPTTGPKYTGTPRHPRSKANELCPTCFKEYARVYNLNTGQGRVG